MKPATQVNLTGSSVCG